MPLEKGHEKSSRLRQINDYLMAIQDPPYELIDTYEEMSGPEGFLPTNYTYDGIHLTLAGYDQWSFILKQYLNEI